MQLASHHRSVAVAFAVAVVALIGLCLAPNAALADPVDYQYWIAHAQTKVYPHTAPPVDAARASESTPAVIALEAARAEFEGRQVAIRPSASLRDVWLQPSALTRQAEDGIASTIPASNVTTYKVHYISIRTPSYPYTRRGLEPDPLLPMTLANGERLGWRPKLQPNLWLRSVPASETRSFYVLFEVPPGAIEGTYTGTVKISASDATGGPVPEVAIPVSLRVYRFSVAKKSLTTAVGFDTGAVRRNTASGDWLPYQARVSPGATRIPETTRYRGDQIAGWMKYLAEHRVSPYYMTPAFENRQSDGTMRARGEVLNDYLGTGTAKTFSGSRFGFNSLKVPLDSMTPWINNPFSDATSTALARRYYSSLATELGPHANKAFVYPKDEPRASDMPLVRQYAALVHAQAPGMKFMLTTDAATQKSRLVSGVDIYAYRLHFVFRDWTYIQKIQDAKKAYWVYMADTIWQKQAPGYLLDKTLADPRAQAWFCYRTRATGLLYYSINQWRGKDPYSTQLDVVWAHDGVKRYSNGDGSLIYPGYYPPLGLLVARRSARRQPPHGGPARRPRGLRVPQARSEPSRMADRRPLRCAHHRPDPGQVDRHVAVPRLRHDVLGVRSRPRGDGRSTVGVGPPRSFAGSPRSSTLSQPLRLREHTGKWCRAGYLSLSMEQT